MRCRPNLFSISCVLSNKSTGDNCVSIFMTALNQSRLKNFVSNVVYLLPEILLKKRHNNYNNLITRFVIKVLFF